MYLNISVRFYNYPGIFAASKRLPGEGQGKFCSVRCDHVKKISIFNVSKT